MTACNSPTTYSYVTSLNWQFFVLYVKFLR